MDGLQNKEGRDVKKPYPGCMGRMTNIFYLSTGMSGTSLLTEKPHFDGSWVQRNQPDVVKKATNPIGVSIENKPNDNERGRGSSRKKSAGTSMKMLLAQETSKEMESKQKTPNVVAKLMGLEALPVRQSVVAAQRSSQDYSCNTVAEVLHDCSQQEDSYLGNSRASEIHSCIVEKDCKNVNELSQQPRTTSWIKDQIPSWEKTNKNSYEKRMSLVHQKFTEAKHLATDEKLFQSKEFQDALEVLSSNKDIFLQFLEEPNSLLSKHLRELHPIPQPSQKQRITVLKPSKTVERKGEREPKKPFHPPQSKSTCETQMCHWSSKFTHRKADKLSQSTRIVVLKPSTGKPQNIKIPFSAPHYSPKLPEWRGFCGGLRTDETTGSRKVAEEISQQTLECLGSEQKNEDLISITANGYDGDESSSSRLENEYIEEEGCKLSNSEIATQTLQHSEDHTNRFGSPSSLSSFSWTSYSSDSLVNREAKKRLLERWTLVSSNAVGREQGEIWSSSTLGEMLAIPEIKKEEEGDGVLAVSSRRSCDNEQDLRAQAACFFIGSCKDGSNGEISSRKLSRSKSVPVPPSAFENSSFDMEVPEALISKTIGPKEMARSRSMKLSFKEKVSSFFFSRNGKNPGRENCFTSSTNFDDKFHSYNVDAVGNLNEESTSMHEGQYEECPLINSSEKSKGASTSSAFDDRSRLCTSTAKSALPPVSSMTSSFHANKDQPSPNSVLDAPFKDEVNNNMLHSCNCDDAGHPKQLSRSPPIESIARSLSRDDNRSDILSPNHLRTSLPEADEECFAFIEKLLSSAGFGNENPSTVFTGWHSLDSPLNPILLDDLLDWNEEKATPRKRQSNRRLVFDCVNEALLDISQNSVLAAFPWLRRHCTLWKESKASSPVNAQVRGLIRDWLSGEGKLVFREIEEDSSQLVDRVVKRELAGKGWTELMLSELDQSCKDICMEVLEELVGEALADFCPAACLC